MTYTEAKATLQNREQKKIGNNTYLNRRADGIALRLHNTDVLLFAPDGKVYVRTGGYRTVTTKARINDYLPGYLSGTGIAQRNGVWYWVNPQTGETAVFGEGDYVTGFDSFVHNADGTEKLHTGAATTL